MFGPTRPKTDARLENIRKLLQDKPARYLHDVSWSDSLGLDTLMGTDAVKIRSISNERDNILER